MSGKKHQAAGEVPLVPFGDLKMAVQQVLSSSKVESDRQLAELQASNLRRREAKKRR
jgi:hypothetical protein